MVGCLVYSAVHLDTTLDSIIEGKLVIPMQVDAKILGYLFLKIYVHVFQI